jgi:hypothetical protein
MTFLRLALHPRTPSIIVGIIAIGAVVLAFGSF